MKVEFQLTGLTALLFHSDDVQASDELKEWREDTQNKNKSIRGDDRSPPWTWTTYLYTDGENIVWPSYNLSVGLRQAGAQILMPNKRGKTFKEVAVSGIQPTAEFLEFTSGGKVIPVAPFAKLRDNEADFAKHVEAARANGFRLFSKRAKIGMAKHVRVRARFDQWEMRGSVIVTATDVINMDKLQELFDIAGRGGQGDWRPACKTPGPFGQFTAKLKKVG